MFPYLQRLLSDMCIIGNENMGSSPIGNTKSAIVVLAL